MREDASIDEESPFIFDLFQREDIAFDLLSNG